MQVLLFIYGLCSLWPKEAPLVPLKLGQFQASSQWESIITISGRIAEKKCPSLASAATLLAATTPARLRHVVEISKNELVPVLGKISASYRVHHSTSQSQTPSHTP